MFSQAMEAQFNALFVEPCSNTAAELKRDSFQIVEPEEDETEKARKVGNEVLQNGDYISLITEAIAESQDYLSFDQIKDAILAKDFTEMGKLFYPMIHGYAVDVAKANGNY
jgi:hypothetical protein